MVVRFFNNLYIQIARQRSCLLIHGVSTAISKINTAAPSLPKPTHVTCQPLHKAHQYILHQHAFCTHMNKNISSWRLVRLIFSWSILKHNCLRKSPDIGKSCYQLYLLVLQNSFYLYAIPSETIYRDKPAYLYRNNENKEYNCINKIIPTLWWD